MREKKDRSIGIIATALVFFVAIIVLVVVFLNSSSEIYVSESGEEKIVTAISCNAESIEGEFFSSSTASAMNNQIKVTFSSDKPDKLFYSFEGVYESDDAAEHENAVFHAKYNEYLGSNGFDHESFTPTFSTVDNKMRINLYVKNFSLINRITPVLFFIDSDDVDDFANYSREQVVKFYESMGFLCEK